MKAALGAALIVFYAVFTFVIISNTVRRPQRVEPIAWCKDPYSEFTGIPFDPCDRVNRYWNI